MRTLILVSLAVFAVACKKPVPPSNMDAELSSSAQPARDAKPAHVAAVIQNFERVRFEYDSATLDSSSRDALSENAAILVANPDVKVEVQGHADERGTTEYNLALGEKRAAAVRQHLLAQNVSPSRLSTISYGEEHPLVAGETETAWSQNRRAEFRVTWAGETLVEGTTR